MSFNTWCLLGLLALAIFLESLAPPVRHPIPVVKESFAWTQN